ncbi:MULTISPECIES: DEAD/DEAH box helicase family protein [Aeromonas]|nr:MULTISPECIES: DEAD/DEAH box helicase family protein [Aeromonas]MCR3937845.1 DEAD/DEAH box helicase family protein [Aeromonas caviae]MDH0433590.1 DEAD/DEAH box helicase family protein [Aeromonas caviae]MDH0936438.1 DEAD/DEAH box helicase family protein [Aeromonas caviae]MDH1397248.1 DEAD/DEAH box helicase family protein [Aeromonas caviae]MDH1849770.1 DEAD/DEAH box helicase family protein [Aeromonas caviae]
MNSLMLVGGGHASDPRFTDPLLPHLLAALAECGQGARIELCVSFIRQSGLLLLREALQQAQARGAHLRVITSDYLDVTQPVALRELLKLDPARTTALVYQSAGNRGFHLKSYLFVRQHCSHHLCGRAFVGSSNISAAALNDSLEWNWSLTVDDSPCVEAQQSLQQLMTQVELLARDPRVVPLTHRWIDAYLARYQQSSLRELRALTGDKTKDAEALRERPMPNKVQLDALAALHATRNAGYQRGLVVMATGLGKTWLAAFDVHQMQAARLLFVAHREEILTQARATFQRLSPSARIGLYQGEQQEDVDWLFASIQTLGKGRHLLRFAPDHFDYIVVDEFHHAASPSYRRLLDHFQPRFLLGLTATPDRTDQADILALCDNNQVFECYLAEAIEQHFLVPLVYHGILDDTIDYAALPWRNGQFDPDALEHAFASQRRAQHALHQWQKLGQQRTLAFCISIRHAEFMAQCFTAAGVRAMAIHAQSSLDRTWVLKQLEAGELDIIFSVDLFNEGTDLPAIDTILMLRPTESRIVFLQQLGRGLRLHPGKERLQVIDLVGNHKACLGKPILLEQQLTYRHGVHGEPVLAPGCFINLDPALLPMLDRLNATRRPPLLQTYRELKEQFGYRPTAHQVWQSMQVNQLEFDTRAFGGWFALVAQEGDLDATSEQVWQQLREFLHLAVETTQLAKSFKLILLQALLELDGLRSPPTLAELASHSRYLLERHPRLLKLDLPDPQQQLAADSASWLRYWRNNPIKHTTGENNAARRRYWFVVKDDRFCTDFALNETQIDQLHHMMQELLDLRMAQYLARKSRIRSAQSTASSDTGERAEVVALGSLRQTAPLKPENSAVESGSLLSYFPNLKIACGHFKHGDESDMALQRLDSSWGELDPKRHFLARASGNSMDGGKQPIVDGDLLLLEWITPDSAGSITGSIMAIEQEDESGLNQYLLRVVTKNSAGQYRLKANNRDYPELSAHENMRTFARLKNVIKIDESRAK